MRIQTTILVAATLCLTNVASPCKAQGIMHILQNYAGNSVTSWADLDAKRTALETQVDAAVKAGQLSAAQSAEFKTKLKQLADAAAAGKASGRRMSFRENISFTQDIYNLTSHLQQAVNTHVASLPDVDALQVELQTKVNNALSSGHLTETDATALKAELKHVADIEAAFKAETDGNLTPRQIELLATDLNAAKSHIDQQIKLGESAVPQLNSRRTALQQKIDNAVAAGRLSTADAATLRAELDQILARQNAFIASGNVLTGSEVLTLASQLDAAEAHADAKIAVATTPTTVPANVNTAALDVRREQLLRRMTTIAATAQLNPALLADDRAQLDQLTELERAYRASATGITQAQVDQIAAALDRLNFRIDRQLERSHPPIVVAPPGGGLPVIPPGSGQPGTVGGGSIPVATVPSNSPPAGGMNLPVISVKNFTDINGYWGQQYVSELASRGVIGGFPNGEFRPNDEITRAQFASIVAHALNLAATGGTRNFTDVPANHWAAGSIGAVANAGLVGGFPDGSFHPDDKLTRAQAIVVLAKALRGANINPAALSAYSDAQAVPSWAQDSVSTAAQARIIVNFPDATQIRPNALATRGEVAGLIYRTLTALGANLPSIQIGVLPSGQRL
jgi:hypothetical protein